MYGAIIGDMVSEAHKNALTDVPATFPLFSTASHCSSVTIMTIAVAHGFLKINPQYSSEEESRTSVAKSLTEWGQKLPGADYGCSFKTWLSDTSHMPYDNDDSLAALCISSAGWLYGETGQTRNAARAAAKATHKNPNAVKGAEATAAAVSMALHGSTKDEIRQYLEENFGYDLSRTYGSTGFTLLKSDSCEETFPAAFAAFVKGQNFEEVIRLAIMQGSPCRSVAVIAGTIAEAFYGIPNRLISETKRRLPKNMLHVLDSFAAFLKRDGATDPKWKEHEEQLAHNGIITDAIEAFIKERSNAHKYISVLDALRFQCSSGKCLIVPCEFDHLPDKIPEDASVSDLLNAKDRPPRRFCYAEDNTGKKWFLTFTDREHLEKWNKCSAYIMPLSQVFRCALENAYEGFIINLKSGDFVVSKQMISIIYAAEKSMLWNVSEGLAPDREEKLKNEIHKNFNGSKGDIFLANEALSNAIYKFTQGSFNPEDEVLKEIRAHVQNWGCFLVPLKLDPDRMPQSLKSATPQDIASLIDEGIILLNGRRVDHNGKMENSLAVFTDELQFCMGTVTAHAVLPSFVIFRLMLKYNEFDSIMINPWCRDKMFRIDRNTVKSIMEHSSTAESAPEPQQPGADAEPEDEEEFLQKYRELILWHFEKKGKKIFAGNNRIQEAMRKRRRGNSSDSADIAMAILQQMHRGKSFLAPVTTDSEDVTEKLPYARVKTVINLLEKGHISLCKAGISAAGDKKQIKGIPLFTDAEQLCKGRPTTCVGLPIDTLLRHILKLEDVECLILDPFEEDLCFIMGKELIRCLIDTFDNPPEATEDN